MTPKPDPVATHVKLLSNLFARFTADRDTLLAAVERCEQRLVDLSERFATTPQAGGEPPGADGKAEQALALANEALLVAREAMKVARHGRGG